VRLALAIVGAGILFTAASFAQQASAPPAESLIVPVYKEPHHRQVFQYGSVRILDLQIPPGDISWFHSHESPVLYVTLSTSMTRTQNLGEDWGGRGRGAAGARPGGPAPEGRGAAPVPATPAAAPAAAGTAAPPTAPGASRGGGAGRGGGAPRATSTTSYAQQPVTHRLENIGTGLFRAMVVINETAGDETTTEQAAGFDGKPELTNRWFRAYRLTLAPGEKTAGHKHHAPVAIIQATSGKGQSVGPMRFEFNDPGYWAFYDAETEHEVRNSGDTPLELIEVEVRRK
jgi:quercetin dioxygenase-like cupin family protein